MIWTNNGSWPNQQSEKQVMVWDSHENKETHKYLFGPIFLLEFWSSKITLGDGRNRLGTNAWLSKYSNAERSEIISLCSSSLGLVRPRERSICIGLIWMFFSIIQESGKTIEKADETFLQEFWKKISNGPGVGTGLFSIFLSMKTPPRGVKRVSLWMGYILTEILKKDPCSHPGPLDYLNCCKKCLIHFFDSLASFLKLLWILKDNDEHENKKIDLKQQEKIWGGGGGGGPQQ